MRDHNKPKIQKPGVETEEYNKKLVLAMTNTMLMI